MKPSSYQKLKQENEKLKQELTELVVNPESIESARIKSRVEIIHNMSKMIMFGSSKGEKLGIFPQVKKHRKMVTYFLGRKW